MLNGEITIYFDNRKLHINALCGQNVTLSNARIGGTYNYQVFSL